MMINRRRVYGKNAISDKSYIQDGLVFQLDGINKGNDPTAWTDLVSGIGFPYNSGQEIRSDSVYFNGNSGLTCVTTSPSFPFTSCQVEVVIDNSQNRKMIVIPSSTRFSNIAFGFYDSYIIGGAGVNARARYDGVFPGGKMSYSLNRNYCYYDDVTLISKYNSYWELNGEVFNVGCRGNDYKYIGNIYSIRIYNRPLTNKERLHNLEVDNKRFNLGLSLNQ